MADGRRNEVLEAAITAVQIAATELEVSDTVIEAIVEALSTIEIFGRARILSISLDSRDGSAIVVVEEIDEWIERYSGEFRSAPGRVAFFRFPPNDREILAELKRAQDYDREVSLVIRTFGGGSTILSLTVLTRPAIPKPSPYGE